MSDLEGMDITFRKSDKRWLAYYDCNFAFIGIADAEARIRELENQLNLSAGESIARPEKQ